MYKHIKRMRIILSFTRPRVVPNLLFDFLSLVEINMINVFSYFSMQLHLMETEAFSFLKDCKSTICLVCYSLLKPVALCEKQTDV